MTLLAVAIGIAGCLIFQSFFSASEIAIVSADDLKLKAAAERGEKSARLLSRLLARRDWLLAATLSATNLATVISAALLTTFMHHYAPRHELIAAFILAPFSVLLGETLPKLVALTMPTRFAYLAAYPLRVVAVVLAPLLMIETSLSRALRYLAGVRGEQSSAFIAREDLARLLQRREKREGQARPDSILPGERFMIGRIFRFTRSEARHAMVPAARVVSVPIDMAQAKVIEVVRREGYSRLPVYEERAPNLVGVVHVFDLLESPDLHRPVRDIMRPVSYFAEATPLDEILLALQRTRESLAVVVDEYGDAAGIITLEDLLEEVVGEIEDEYDVREELARPVGPQTLAVVARTPLSVLNERYGLRLPEGEGYATVGGLVVEGLGHIPKPGEQLKVADVTLKVVRSDARAVRDLLLTLDRPLRPESQRRS